jgi:hypothetical protein
LIDSTAPFADASDAASAWPAFKPAATPATVAARAVSGENSFRKSALAWASSRAFLTSCTTNRAAAAALSRASLCCSGWLNAPALNGF